MENLVKFIKNQILLILITFVIGGIGLYVFMPKFREYQKIKKEIEVQNQKITVLTRKLNDLNTLSEKELEDNVNLSLKSLPTEKDFYSVVKNIKNIFGQEGMLLSAFQFTVGEISTESAKKASADKPEFFGISLSFSGPVDKTEMVISRLENSLPLLSIDSLKLTSDSSSSSGQLGNYSGTMSLKSHFALLPKTLESIDKELPKINSPQNKQLEELSVYEYYSEVAELPVEGIVVGKENPFPVY